MSFMHLSVSRFRRLAKHKAIQFHVRSFLLLSVFAVFANVMFGANALTSTPSTITLSCNTASGPGTQVNITIKPAVALTGSNTIVVSLGTLPAGIVAVTTPANQTLSTANQTAGIVYTLNYAAGCVGATAGTSTPTFRVNAGATPDVTVTVNSTVTASASALTPSPSSVALSCVKNGSTYTPGPAKTVSITSAATGGTAFTVDTSTSPAANWATITPTTGGTATGTAVTFAVQAASGCGGFATGSTNNTVIHLLNAPAPDKTIPVSLQVVGPSPLTFSPTAPKLTYTKGSASAAYVDVNVTSAANPAPFFSVDTTTLPIWLTVDSTSGKTPKSIRFSTTTVAETLAPGTYSTTVYLKVSGFGDLGVPITMLVTNSAPKLTFAEGITRNLNWTIGTPAPTPVITAVSSDSPISYVATTSGTLAPSISGGLQKGLAYSFGTQIPVTFDPTVLASAQPGTTLTGTVTFTWGSPSTTSVVTFNVSVASPGATISAISPASLPTAPAGQSFTVAVSGTGFIPSADLSQRTRVGVVVNNAIIADTNIAWNVVNPSSIIMTITSPASADQYLPFSTSGNGGSVTLGVCNPSSGTPCTIPSATVTLSIGNGPIVQVVTSASSYIQVNPGTAPTVAPYDIISIFGTNFCTSGGTGCSSGQILYGTPDAALRYPSSLSPDSPSATQRSLTVKFQTHATPPVLIATGNLLFATNNQINVMAPSGLTGNIGSNVDVVVSFGYGSGTTMLNSTPFPVSVAATNPGVFTVGADGQGDGAALNSADYLLIAPGHEGGMRSTASDSDTVLLYVTGLGAPDSTADNANTGSSAWSADCITTASYLTSLNALTGGSLTTVDGLIIQPSLLNTGRLSPCVKSSSADVPTVTVGGVPATVGYAGWVAGSIAGLYQINIKLPGSAAGPFTDATGATVSSITAPVSLPVVVTANSLTSQSGVTLWVAPRLKVVAPTALTGTVGTAWASSNNSVVASEGTSPYRYALTSGLLPSGLSLNTSTGAITGTPAANTAGSYTVTVTATDSANVPVRDSVTFTVTIAGGLVVASSGTAPYTGTFGTANATLTTISATGGVYPYTFAITSPASLPTGMTIDANTGVIGITALTPAGTYHVTVTATDSTADTPLTGTATFDIVVALHVVSSGVTAGTAAQVNANLGTVSATGNTGTVSYTIDSTTSPPAWFTVNSSTGVIGTTSSAVAGTYSVTVIATDSTTATGAASAGTGKTTVSITIN
jgi:uncharacterized protein (TIGR03437 family)